MLTTNFSSHYETVDDQEATDIVSFETKPKSGVTEFVPSKIRKLLEENKEKYQVFLSKKDLVQKFLSNRFTKFHVM